jgi:hypothetical protein
MTAPSPAGLDRSDPDAAVLAALLVERDVPDQDLWDAFHARRYERVRTVVDQLARWLLDHVRGDAPSLFRHIAARTGRPA